MASVRSNPSGSRGLVTAKKGARSTRLSSCKDLSTVATSSSGRRSLPPWPGKCLATVSTLPSLPACTPWMYARPISLTQ